MPALSEGTVRPTVCHLEQVRCPEWAKISLATIVGKTVAIMVGEKTSMRIFPLQYEPPPDTRPGATVLHARPRIGAIVMSRAEDGEPRTSANKQ